MTKVSPFMLCLLLLGCGSKPPAESPPAESPTAQPPAEGSVDAPAHAERPAITADECTAGGGTVVGDIGDGAIHKPEYRCPSGAEPSGSIKSTGGEPVAVEGSVCCPG